MLVPLGAASRHDELVDLLRARKEALGLSDAHLEHMCDMTPGHCTKLLGPARTKGLGRFSLDLLLEVLAVDIMLVSSPAKAQRMESRWEKRCTDRVHIDTNRLASTVIKRAQPHVMAAMGSRGGKARMASLNPMQRSEIARYAAYCRWHAHRKRRAGRTVRVRREGNG